MEIVSTELAALTKQKFHSRSIGLPIEWLDKDICPPDAFTQVERSARANPSDTLFQEPTLNKYHTDTARVTGTIFEEYIDGICAALSSSVSMWMRIASVMAMTTAGPVGTLMPGGVTGPELEPFILAEAPEATPMERQYSRAIAKAVSEAWNDWQIGLSGILQYPGFMGAPLPNSPAPLMSLASAGELKLAPQNLSKAMLHHFNEPDFLHSRDLFASVSEAFYTRFQEFKMNTIVTGVIAAGSSASGLVVPTPGNFV